MYYKSQIPLSPSVVATVLIINMKAMKEFVRDIYYNFT